MLNEGPDLGRLQNAPLWNTTRNDAKQDYGLKKEELHGNQTRVLEYTFGIVREERKGVLAKGNDQESCEQSRLLNHNEAGFWSKSAHVHHFEGAGNIHLLLLWYLEVYVSH